MRDDMELAQDELDDARQELAERGPTDDGACDRFWDAWLDAQRYGLA